MNYLDVIAAAIQREADPEATPPDEDLPLYRQYAVLLLTKGDTVTAPDVHHAWAAWASEHDSSHRHLVPFKELSLSEQKKDEPYAEAIRTVATAMGVETEEISSSEPQQPA